MRPKAKALGYLILAALGPWVGVFWVGALGVGVGGWVEVRVVRGWCL